MRIKLQNISQLIPKNNYDIYYKINKKLYFLKKLLYLDSLNPF